MAGLNIQIPKDKEELKKQIEALKYQIKQDTREKDKKIHTRALKELEKAYKDR